MQFFIIIPQKNHKIKLHLGYKSCISITKVAFRIQKLRFVYKYSVINYKDCILLYKVASRFSIKPHFTPPLLPQSQIDITQVEIEHLQRKWIELEGGAWYT
jgi:hypothetical protein